jgi:hypothetical protein
VNIDLENDPIAGIRRVGDKQTWVYDLNTTGIAFDDAPPVPDSVIETATFKVCRKGLASEWFCTCNGDRYSLRAISRFSHSIFKHIYTTLSEEHLGSHWNNDDDISQLSEGLWDLQDEIEGLTLKELAKVPFPSAYDKAYYQTMRGEVAAKYFKWDVGKVPEGWVYVDDELVKDLEKLWKQHTEASKQGQEQAEGG